MPGRSGVATGALPRLVGASVELAGAACPSNPEGAAGASGSVGPDESGAAVVVTADDVPPEGDSGADVESTAELTAAVIALSRLI